jgi:hypothetical protein
MRSLRYARFHVSPSFQIVLNLVSRSLRMQRNHSPLHGTQLSGARFLSSSSFKKHGGTWQISPRFAEVEDAIRAGLKNLEKWYRKADETDVYFICLGTVTPYSHSLSLLDCAQHSIPIGSWRTLKKNGLRSSFVRAFPSLSRWYVHLLPNSNVQLTA